MAKTLIAVQPLFRTAALQLLYIRNLIPMSVEWRLKYTNEKKKITKLGVEPKPPKTVGSAQLEWVASFFAQLWVKNTGKLEPKKLDETKLASRKSFKTRTSSPKRKCSCSGRPIPIHFSENHFSNK